MKRRSPSVIRAAAAAAASAVVLFGVSACSGDGGETVDGIHLVEKGALTVCTHLPYKPFQFTNDDGKVVGFDVDLLRLLAKDLGVKEKVVSMDWNQITSGAVFEAGKCDIAMGGATITEKRKEAVQFSSPYFDATQALLVKKDSDIAGPGDLQGKRLGIQTSTTGAVYARKHQEKYGYKTVVFQDLALLTTGVSAGKVAAAIGDNAPLYQYTQDHPNTRVAAEFDTGEHYGFIAQKNDDNADKLIKRFNKILAKAKKSGQYKQIFKKWFGQAPGKAKKQQ